MPDQSDGNRRVIVIVAGAALLLCCCCALAAAGWFCGDIVTGVSSSCSFTFLP